MEYAIFLILAFVQIVLYAINRKLFLAVILVMYPIAAQMVSKDFNFFETSLNLSMIYGFLIFVFCLIETIRILVKRLPTGVDGVFLAVLLFIWWAVIVSFFSTDVFFKSIVTTIKISTWMLLLIVAREHLTGWSDLRKVANAALVGALIIVLAYVLSAAGIYGEQSTIYRAYGLYVPSGGFFRPTSIAYPLAMCVPILMLRGYLKPHKTMSFLFLGTCLLTILLSFVRSPFIAIAVGYIAYVFYLNRYLSKKILGKLLASACVLILVATVFLVMKPGSATTRWSEFDTQYKKGTYEKLGSGRAGQVKQALAFMLRETSGYRLLVGHGMGNSNIATGGYWLVHPSIVSLWVDAGIIGLIIYSILFFKVWQRLKSLMKRGPDERMKMAGVFGMMTFFIFLFSNLDTIITAVFPLSFFSIHVGATLGLADNPKQLPQAQ